MNTSKNTSKRYPKELKERAVRMVLEHSAEYDSEWQAIRSIAGKSGMTTETLRKWVCPRRCVSCATNHRAAPR